MRRVITPRRLLIAVFLGLIVAVLFAGVHRPKVNPIALENQLPGTTDWQSPDLDAALRAPRISDDDDEDRSYADSGKGSAALWTGPRVIQGYAGRTSINHGESIDLYVSTTQPSYKIDIYRFGWYSGTGARLITSVSNLPGSDHGVPNPNPATGLIEAHWPIAYTLQTTPTWVSGMYQAKLTASNGSVSYLIFVVRADESTSDILYQVGISTYQAYNNWGGKSLYDFNSTNGRAYKVSYDRPYELANGAGYFYDGDYEMIRWIERQGYNVSYATSIDLEADTHLMDNHKVFLVNYHDEYYSMTMRNNVTAFRDAGKHLAYFAANNIYFQVRFEASSSGVPNRVQVCYKDRNIDPMAQSTTPRLTTVLFRDPPVSMPENAVTGVMYGDFIGYGKYFSYIVQNSNHWIYEGTGLQDGDAIPKIVTNEDDRVYNNGFTPANLIVLSNSPTNTADPSNASIYTAASGALVFDASTHGWSYSLDDGGYDPVPFNPTIERMTVNLLNRMIGLTSGTPAPTHTFTPSFTPSATVTPTDTPTPGPSNTPTDTPTHTNTPAATGWKVQYRAGNAVTTNNLLEPDFNIFNTTGGSVLYSQLKIRYYFTRDTANTLVFACEFAAIGCSGKVTGTFVPISPAVGGADYYLEVGFTSTAGSLATGRSSGEILVGIHKSNWSNFNQLNDYSFDRTKTSFTDWTRVTLYRNGVLVWGTPPTAGTPAPTNTPTLTRTPTVTLTPTNTATVAETTTPGPSSTPPADMIRLQYKPGNTITASDNIEPEFKIINETNNPIPLPELRIRYYFTQDTARPLIFACEYASLGCAKITGTIVPLNPALDGADYYVEVGFTDSAGTLAVNGQVNDILIGIHKSDWGAFNQANDYSYDPTRINFADATRATLYRNGVLVWGEPPESAPGNVAATFEP